MSQEQLNSMQIAAFQRETPLLETQPLSQAAIEGARHELALVTQTPEFDLNKDDDVTAPAYLDADTQPVEKGTLHQYDFESYTSEQCRELIAAHSVAIPKLRQAAMNHSDSMLAA